MIQPISVIRGTTQMINIDLVDAGGAPYSLGNDEVLRFGVKRRPEDEDYLLEKELTAVNQNEDGTYILTLEPDDTARMKFGRYYYDVGMQSGEQYYNVIECSNFHIRYNITAHVRGTDTEGAV